MTQDGSSGWRGLAGRLAEFLWHADERTAVSPAARTADAAIAVAAVIAAVVAVIMQTRTARGYDVFIPGPGFKPVVFQGAQKAFPTGATLIGAVLTTAPLAFRRTYPIVAFCVVLGAVLGSTGHTTSITFAAAIFAAYSAVAYSRFRQLALLSVLAGAVVVTAAYPDTTPPVPERFTALLILLPTASVAVAIRVWRGRARESAERLRRAQAGHEAETRRAVEVERARIASELHDVVTHNVSVMVVQAGAARRVLDSSPADAREALLAVEASGRTAMTELRHLLGLLAPSGEVEADGAVRASAGAADASLTPQPGAARIPALIDRVCAAGMPVELSVQAPGGTPPDLPLGVDLAAFRVVQEALTNVMKHTGQARTTVRLDYRPAELLITVSDDGGSAAADPAAGGGRGLIGLRERIAVYGGELDAGPRPGGGWRLTARIPLEAARIPLEAARIPLEAAGGDGPAVAEPAGFQGVPR